MATPTYDLLDSVTLSSSASSVTFSSIDQSYRDLVLAVEVTGISAVVTFNVVFNSDAVTEVEWVRMRGSGTAASSGAFGGVTYFRCISAATNTSASHILQLLDYSTTGKQKSGLYRGNNAGSSNGVQASAMRWLSTSAINTVKIETGANTYAAGSTFYLYGVAA